MRRLLTIILLTLGITAACNHAKTSSQITSDTALQPSTDSNCATEQSLECELQKFVGVYSYQSHGTDENLCPQSLSVKMRNIQGRSTPHIGFYCTDINECTTESTTASGGRVNVIDNIFYEFSRINQGPIDKLTRDAMFDQPNGYRFVEETLEGNKLTGKKRTMNLSRTVKRSSEFNAKLDADFLHLSLTRYAPSRSSNPKESSDSATTQKICVFKKN